MGVFEQVTSAERSNRAHDWRGVAGAAGGLNYDLPLTKGVLYH